MFIGFFRGDIVSRRALAARRVYARRLVERFESPGHGPDIECEKCPSDSRFTVFGWRVD